VGMPCLPSQAPLTAFRRRRRVPATGRRRERDDKGDNLACRSVMLLHPMYCAVTTMTIALRIAWRLARYIGQRIFPVMAISFLARA
jgi:hypothetical protein